MTPDVALNTEPASLAAEAAALVEDAFPVPFLEMNQEFIAWALAAHFDPTRPPLAATARDDGRLVGFIGAAARPVRIGPHAETAYIATFLATARDHRGGSLVSGFYGLLLEHIARLDAPVLTYTVAGSIGDLVTLATYRRAGFTGRALEPFVTWGATRGRTRSDGPEQEASTVPTIALDSARAGQHLDADPRGSRGLSGGARVTTAWRRTIHGREPVLILEMLPVPLTNHTLARAVEEAFATFPEHSRVLTLPAVPESAGALAESTGLRRLAVPPYHPWVWAARADHPALAAGRTTHPIL